MPEIDQLLNWVLEQGASDIHLATGSCPTMRVHGLLKRIGDDVLHSSVIEGHLREIMPADLFAQLPYATNVDFVYASMLSGGQVRFRGNAYFQKNGPNIVLRAVPSVIRSLEELGLPSELTRLTDHHQGMVLVTGAAGCGKSSTLAALIEHINATRRLHIITIEDPIEFVYESKVALVNQRQVGIHVESFLTALTGALREDPDVILVGEMRDLETTQMAIRAAETGHLVFSTLHTSSGPKTVDRLIDSFPYEQQGQIRTMLAESLKGIITQQLVPQKDGKGRVVALEVLICNHAVAHMIRKGETFQLTNTMLTGKNQGMRIMDHSLVALVREGKIAKKDALLRMQDRTLLTHVEVAP